MGYWIQFAAQVVAVTFIMLFTANAVRAFREFIANYRSYRNESQKVAVDKEG